MPISRAQIPESVDIFQEGGAAETDSYTERLQQIREQFEPDYDKSFEEYRQRLEPYIYQQPKTSIFDVAADLGAGLLSTPNTGGSSLYVGLGAGFNRISDRIRQQKSENAKARQEIAMQAAMLAMQDERQAEEFLQQASLKFIDTANKRSPLLTFEYKDENGEIVRKSVRDNMANDQVINDLINNKGAIEVKTPGSVVNVNTGKQTTKRDEKAIDLQYKFEEQLSKDADAAYGIVDNVDYAMQIADELGPEGFGAVEAFTFYPRKVMQALGYGDLADVEKLGKQQVLNQLGMGFTMAIVSQTKGAISNREMELFIQASPGMGSTYEGFKKQGEYLRKIAERDIDFYDAYQKKADELEAQERAGEISATAVYRELQKYKNEWQAANPLFTDEDIKYLESVRDNEDLYDENFDRDAVKKQFEKRRDELSKERSSYTSQKGINPPRNELEQLKQDIINGVGEAATLTDEEKQVLLRQIESRLN
jgi:hypothetical protein